MLFVTIIPVAILIYIETNYMGSGDYFTTIDGVLFYAWLIYASIYLYLFVTVIWAGLWLHQSLKHKNP